MSNKVDLEEKIVDGQYISPVLPDNVKNYLIDIDGTICDDIPNEEPERMATAGLYPDALETLNKWYGEGHIITFFTSSYPNICHSCFSRTINHTTNNRKSNWFFNM